jgi:hypothetical protein
LIETIERILGGRGGTEFETDPARISRIVDRSAALAPSNRAATGFVPSWKVGKLDMFGHRLRVDEDSLDRILLRLRQMVEVEEEMERFRTARSLHECSRIPDRSREISRPIFTEGFDHHIDTRPVDTLGSFGEIACCSFELSGLGIGRETITDKRIYGGTANPASKLDSCVQFVLPPFCRVRIC